MTFVPEDKDADVIISLGYVTEMKSQLRRYRSAYQLLRNILTEYVFIEERRAKQLNVVSDNPSAAKEALRKADAIVKWEET